MDQAPSSPGEPKTPSTFLFVPQNGFPIKDAATRNYIRQQVMQHVGRQKRKPGLIRQQPTLRYSLDVHDDFVIRQSATALLSVPSHPQSPQSNDRDLTNQPCKAILPRVSPEFGRASAMGMAPGFESFSFDRLGAGSLDPFAKYPFTLDHRARELMWTVHGANSGPVSPFTVVAFRQIWVEVSMIDPAAFHQYLAGAQAYFDFLRSAQPEKFSHQVVSHHACALRLVNTKVANAATASSDGVIASLVLLARYYQMIGEFAKWRMHMLGLKAIISLRGEIDAIRMHELLRHMLSNIDISGSFAVDTPPIFPIPSILLPPPSFRSPSPMLDPTAKHLINIWRSKLPDHTQLVNIIDDICVENLHLRDEILRSQGTLWTETMYICHYINPLLHRILVLPSTDLPSPAPPVAELLRLGAAIYLAAIRYAFGITPFQPEAHAQKIKASLANIELTGTESNVLDMEWGWVKIWVLGCAVIARPSDVDKQWLIDHLQKEMGNLGLKTYDEFERHVGCFLWIPEVHGLLLRGADSTNR